MPEWNETLRCNLINTGCRDIDGADDLSEILCVCEVVISPPLCYHVIQAKDFLVFASRDSESRETFAVDPIKSPGPLFMVGRAEWSLNRALFTVCINLFSWSRGSEILHNKPTNYMPEWNETLRCNLINTGCRDIDGADDLSEILCVCEVARKLRSSTYCKAAWV
ncbi:hypothetical protein CDAR_290671 [Caerostris darwini]|uniref:Uncharacterized protein n=1 Tax=Caerostris darwini TaxID=1538125 RepID=A0AAV4STX4_9ARAC|nr:hypothetical protein CDAR_290671 [Caerostris darwini]